MKLLLVLTSITTFYSICWAILPKDFDPEKYLQLDQEVQCVQDAYPPKNKSRALRWFSLDLDTSPEQRWRPIVREYKKEIQTLTNQIINLLSVIDIDHWLVKLVNDNLPKLLDSFPAVYRKELSSIAEETQVPIVFSVCTSIVAERSDGQIIHGRNLDFGLFLGWDFHKHTWSISETLRRMVFNLNVTRAGESVYKQTAIAGFIGVLTGVTKGTGLTINERFTWDGGYMGLLKWVSGDRDQAWTTWLSREVLEQQLGYTDAMLRLQKETLISPVYFILSGHKPDQGAVITRARNATDDTHSLAAKLDKRWYVLETNYDRWKKPFILDNRRTPAEKCMNESSRETVSKASIFNVLSTDPVLNRLTVYTTLMDPVTGQMESYLQNCPDCAPW